MKYQAESRGERIERREKRAISVSDGGRIKIPVLNTALKRRRRATALVERVSSPAPLVGSHLYSPRAFTVAAAAAAAAADTA